MKIVIPAKGNSTRVQNKNWRPFYKDISLTELKIQQLLACFEANSIFLSCEDSTKKILADKYKIGFLERNDAFSKDEMPWSDVVYGVVEQIPCSEDEDIMWTEVTNPLFNDFLNITKTWYEVKKEYDSIVTVSEIKDFLINEFGVPVNFNYGAWHKPSQQLRPLYSFETPCIMKKRDILDLKYIIGRNPYLFINKNKTVEIDSEFDFSLAQDIFIKRQTGNSY